MSASVFLFPGQGAQAVGMAADLYAQGGQARKLMDDADALLREELGGRSLKTMMFEGPEPVLVDTAVQQPAIVLASLAALTALREALMDDNWRPACAAGLSLGEYSAHACAGTFDPLTAIRLVAVRGRLMAQAAAKVESSMASVLSEDWTTVAEVCQQVCTERGSGAVVAPANYNSPGQVVIAGDVESLKAAVEGIKARGIRRVIPLKVSGAFHTRLMEPAVDGMREALEKATLSDPVIPVYANVSAAPVQDRNDARDTLLAQLVQPVRWSESIQAMHAAGLAGFAEVGPGTVLAGLLKRTLKDVAMHPAGNAEQVGNLAALLTGTDA